MLEDTHQCTQDTETLKFVKQICAEVSRCVAFSKKHMLPQKIKQ
jgi:hypothetical protein